MSSHDTLPHTGSDPADEENDNWVSDGDDKDEDEDDHDVISDSYSQELSRRKTEKIQEQLEGKESGCHHYDRLCKIVAPCCGEIFWCRHCHNDAKNAIQLPGSALNDSAHEIDRFAIAEVICVRCKERQAASNFCKTCDAPFAEFFCSICKFWDNKGLEKQVFHCEKCGICRVGGRENFFHCDTCASCYQMSLNKNHKCIERSMHGPCSICLEEMFNCVRPVSVLTCGHTIHQQCLEMLSSYGSMASIRCPMCMKTMGDGSFMWKAMDNLIAHQSLAPEETRQCTIKCRDCSMESVTVHHFIASKCPQCGSYNTLEQ